MAEIYEVTYEFKGYLRREVAADSPEQAKEKAKEQFEHHCKHCDGMEDVEYRITDIENENSDWFAFDYLVDERGQYTQIDM